MGVYLWLLANGVDPLKIVDALHRSPEPIPALVGLVQRYTGTSARSIKDATTEAAAAELPTLAAFLESATR